MEKAALNWTPSTLRQQTNRSSWSPPLGRPRGAIEFKNGGASKQQRGQAILRGWGHLVEQIGNCSERRRILVHILCFRVSRSRVNGSIWTFRCGACRSSARSVLSPQQRQSSSALVLDTIVAGRGGFPSVSWSSESAVICQRARSAANLLTIVMAPTVGMSSHRDLRGKRSCSAANLVVIVPTRSRQLEDPSY